MRIISVRNQLVAQRLVQHDHGGTKTGGGAFAGVGWSAAQPRLAYKSPVGGDFGPIGDLQRGTAFKVVGAGPEFGVLLTAVA